MLDSALISAYLASRDHGYRAGAALAQARRNLAAVPIAESELTAAKAEHAAVVDRRRYAPEMVAAGARLDKAQARLRSARRAVEYYAPSGRAGIRAGLYHLNKPFAIGGYASAQGQWCEAPGGVFRFVGLSADIAPDRERTTGYYTDSDGSNGEIARGVVYQMAPLGGRARYIPAVADPCNADADGRGPAVLAIADMVTADSSTEDDSEDARKDAARRAMQLAEYYAEQSREHDAAWQAGNRYAELGAEIADERTAALALLAERRAARGMVGFPAICATIRASVAAHMAAISEARAEREKLADGDYVSDWLCGWNTSDASLRAAFNDAAGIA